MNEALKHDLRHWLTALLGALSQDDVPLARQAAEQMAALLDEPRPEVLAVNPFLRALAPLLGARLALAEPDMFVHADPAALSRVLINLAANARKAMPEGGTLTLHAGRDGDFATIAVEDTGLGIPPNVLAQAFEPGFTTRRASGGTGLGLAIVRDIVEAAGGSVSADSAVGRGTTMTLRWPAVDPKNLPLPLREGDSLLRTAMTVLLVEDEPIVRRLAERALIQAGWRVVAAESGEAALAAVRRLTPDAVIADLTLPGMDGRALVAALRGMWPKLPAVHVSGYTDSAARADPTDGNTVFLAKPYTLAALVAALGSAVGAVVRN